MTAADVADVLALHAGPRLPQRAQGRRPRRARPRRRRRSALGARPPSASPPRPRRRSAARSRSTPTILRAALDPAACAAARLQTGSSSPAAMHAMLERPRGDARRTTPPGAIGARERADVGRGRAARPRTRARGGVSGPRFQRARAGRARAARRRGPDRARRAARPSRSTASADARRLRRGLAGVGRVRARHARRLPDLRAGRRRGRSPSSVCAISRPSSTATSWQAASLATQLVDYARTTRFCGVCARRARVGAAATSAAPARTATTPPTRASRRARSCSCTTAAAACCSASARTGRSTATRCSRASSSRASRSSSAPRREVLEEVGVVVDELRYVGSQSWPFPSQLMVGFTARYASGDDRRRPRGARVGRLVRARRPARAATAALDRAQILEQHTRGDAQPPTPPEPRFERARSGSPDEPAPERARSGRARARAPRPPRRGARRSARAPRRSSAAGSGGR